MSSQFNFPFYHLLLALLIGIAVLYSARRNRASVTKSGLAFGPVPLLKTFFAVMAILMLALALLVRNAEPEARLFLIALTFASFLLLPPTLLMNDEGLTSKYWWGRAKHIPWSQIHSITENDFMNEALVASTGAVTIKHTENHVDRKRFLLEARARSAPYLGIAVGNIPIN